MRGPAQGQVARQRDAARQRVVHVSTSSKKARDACLPIRVSASEAVVLQLAAGGVPVTTFMRSAALSEARRIIACDVLAHGPRQRRNGAVR